MKAKIRSFWQQMLRSPKEFPVETAMGFAFFIIAVWHIESRRWVGGNAVSDVNEDILFLFVPLIVLTYWLNRLYKRQTAQKWKNVCILAYVLSGLLFFPLMALDLKSFIETIAFGFTYVLAGILLVVGTRWMDNRGFAAHVLHVVTQLFIGCAISGLLNLTVFAIVASFIYIFGLDVSSNIYVHIASFVWFVLAPQICFTLMTQDEDEVNEPVKPLRIILDFILSPAVIVYTVILYLYFITIAVKWDLPKGNVAWLITGFIAVALIGRLMQYVLTKRHYDWFYNHLPWIAIPPLVLYWIGSVYRISVYSFTESRFYLIVAGVLMTLFIMMLIWKRTRKFQLMALIAAGAIVVFTYIPGISAKSIGLRCQMVRFHKLATELKVFDAKTGLLPKTVDFDAIHKDSLLCEQYRELCSVISYVREDMGKEAFFRQYGQWKYNEYHFDYRDGEAFPVPRDYVELTQPLNLGDYNVLLPNEKYIVYHDGDVVKVMLDSKEIMSYPIDNLVRQNPALLDTPERLCTYRNDSLFLVLSGFEIRDKQVVHVNTGNFMLFRKKQ